jgi:hypothetical protein
MQEFVKVVGRQLDKASLPREDLIPQLVNFLIFIHVGIQDVG